MKKGQLIMKASKLARTVKIKAKKNSPELLLGAGIVGMVSAGVMACRATLKVVELKKDTEELERKIDKSIGRTDKETGEVIYTEEDAENDRNILRIKTPLKIAGLYAPSVLLAGASAACLIGGHRIVKGRLGAMTAAYIAESNAFKDYQERVKTRFGETVEKELRYGAKIEDVEVEKDGVKTTEKRAVASDQPLRYSPHAIIFARGNKGWDPDPQRTKFHLLQMQEYCNIKLRTQGSLFLNEVYDLLDVPRTTLGAQVGWIYSKENPVGDNEVDFGIFNLRSPKAVDFVNGLEEAIVLDFNVDGPIYERL